MKTHQKVLALSIFSLSATVSFGQLGLGVTSTTQAAVNATANTAAVVSTTNAATAATKSTVSAVATKTMNTAATVKNDVKKSTDVNAGISVKASSAASQNSGSVQANGSADAGVQVNGSQVIDKAENKTKAVVETAKEVKSKAVNEVKSTSVSVDAKTETKATVNKQ